jgi:hypothetical protein
MEKLAARVDSPFDAADEILAWTRPTGRLLPSHHRYISRSLSKAFTGLTQRARQVATTTYRIPQLENEDVS